MVSTEPHGPHEAQRNLRMWIERQNRIRSVNAGFRREAASGLLATCALNTHCAIVRRAWRRFLRANDPTSFNCSVRDCLTPLFVTLNENDAQGLTVRSYVITVHT